MDIVIVNEGQLKFALEKPKMSIYGHEQYSELYQKAAALMEAITKIHALSDGNKRTAMIVAELMIAANDGHLVLPLKAIRLSVDVAMDESDTMSDIIQQWFKNHIAMNNNQLCAMLGELIEEESLIRNMLNARRFEDAEDILSTWMAFDTYPTHKKTWKGITDQWKCSEEIVDSKSNLDDFSRQWQKTWKGFKNDAGHTYTPLYESIKSDVEKINDLTWRENSYEQLIKIVQYLEKTESKFANSKEPKIVHKKGMLLWYGKEYDAAIKEFKQLIKIDDCKTDALYHIADIYHVQKKYEKALEYWQQFLVLEPYSKFGLRMCATTLSRMGLYAKGIEMCDLIPDKVDQDTLLVKASCMIGQHKYDDAKTILTKILQSDSKNIQCHHGLGHIAMEKNDYSAAVKHYDMIINLEPNSFYAYYNKAIAIDKMDSGDHTTVEEQLELYKKSLKLNPEHAESWINLGRVLSNNGRRDDAIPYLQRGLVLKPNHKVALMNLGIAHMYLGDYNTSTSYVDQMLQINPNHKDALFVKSAIYAQTNMVLECLECLENVITSNPEYKERVRNECTDLFKNVKDSQKFQKLINNCKVNS